jgi:hypothetical protein
MKTFKENDNEGVVQDPNPPFPPTKPTKGGVL